MAALQWGEPFTRKPYFALVCKIVSYTLYSLIRQLILLISDHYKSASSCKHDWMIVLCSFFVLFFGLFCFLLTQACSWQVMWVHQYPILIIWLFNLLCIDLPSFYLSLLDLRFLSCLITLVSVSVDLLWPSPCSFNSLLFCGHWFMDRRIMNLICLPSNACWEVYLRITAVG